MTQWKASWSLMPSNTTGTLRSLGLCAKARKLVCGTPMICEALRGRGKPFLVLSASDNSENTQKKLSDKCAYYGVRLVVLSVGGEELSRAVGKQSRVAAVAVTDENLCRLVESTLKDDGKG